MNQKAEDIHKSQDGFVLVASLFILVIVSIVGIHALTNSNTELNIIRNAQQMTLEFYEAEYGLFEAIEYKDLWMTDDFLVAKEVVPDTTTYMDTFPDDHPDSPGESHRAYLDIRPIRDTDPDPDAGEVIPGYSEEAYDLPMQKHVGAPPAGSGYSMKNFEIRRYGVTSASRTGGTVLQAGAWKIFNKYE